jgi:5-hydroxyisourate hydrolase
MGRLTTHVLDLASGRPAAGMRIELFAVGGGEKPLAAALTNADGRLEKPLIEGPAFTAGTYELRFHAGDYWAAGSASPGEPFLDVIPIRFRITARGEHYHVPLLLSPFGYSTYRGS